MVTEDEMAGWHHQLNGHESEQTLRDGEGQRSLACCSLGVAKSHNLATEPETLSLGFFTTSAT